MLWPDYKQFAALANNATLVPVAKTVAADLRTPVSAFLSIAGDEKRAPNAFLLESVEGGEKVGRYTFLGVRPYMCNARPRQPITLEKGRTRQQLEGNPSKFWTASCVKNTSRHIFPTAALHRRRRRLLFS